MTSSLRDRWGDSIVIVAIAIMLTCAATARADEPASRPSAEAPTGEGMKQLLADLGDKDAEVRESARQALMGIESDDLPAFRRVVSDARPLLPSQVAVLRDIVVQVFLSGQDYEVEPRAGFLGAELSEASPEDSADEPPEEDAEDADASLPRARVVVSDKVPGFCGNRMLEVGDVILGVRERPYLRIRSSLDLINVIRSTPAGRTLRLQVMRQGKLVMVPVKLDPRPDGLQTKSDIIQFQYDRMQRAEDYWDRNFAPLVGGKVG